MNQKHTTRKQGEGVVIRAKVSVQIPTQVRYLNEGRKPV